MAGKRFFTLAALFLVAGFAGAADDPMTPAKDNPKQPPKDARKLGSDEACCHTFSRMGFPQALAPCARPTESCGYCGYFVGGGSVRLGGSTAPACPTLGTWGRDWCGCCLWHPRVLLGWGDRYQGGTGSYRTDGHPVPDLIAGAVALPETVHHKREERKSGAEPR